MQERDAYPQAAGLFRPRSALEMATVTSPRRHRPAAPVPFHPGTNGFAIHIPAKALTLDGFRVWAKSDELPEKLRVAYIDQEIYLEMSNEELETHVLVKGEICRVVSNLNRELKLGKFYVDGVLVTNKAAKVSNNPEALFVSWSALESKRVRLIPRRGEQGQFTEVVGTPDWILEVVSDSTVRKDTKGLREAYHRARIPEYWLVDARGPEIIFRIL